MQSKEVMQCREACKTKCKWNRILQLKAPFKKIQKSMTSNFAPFYKMKMQIFYIRPHFELTIGK